MKETLDFTEFFRHMNDAVHALNHAGSQLNNIEKRLSDSEKSNIEFSHLENLWGAANHALCRLKFSVIKAGQKV